MWFKKKSVLIVEGNYSTEKSADGSTDLRTSNDSYTNINSSINNSGLPSAADAGNYFYLPASGNYYLGGLYNVGNNGYYWSSSAAKYNLAFKLDLGSGHVYVSANDRTAGYRGMAFE